MNQDDALTILKAGRNVYLTGPAGSGKTHTLKSYIDYLKDRGVSVGLTASTGIAATHIGGMTIHSWSGIGIKEELTEYDIDALTQKEKLVKRFKETPVLIIDEVSMITPRFFNSLDWLAREMRGTEAPFGGMQVVLSGDFFQLPPITRGTSRVEFIFHSEAWRKMDVRVCYLEEQFRQERDDMLGQILSEMRKGEIEEETYVVLQEHKKTFTDDITPTRLYTHNIDVDALNEKEIEKLPGNGKVFHAQTKGKAALVTALQKGILAPEELLLKKDAQVMFVKNNFEAGYVNGTLGIVEDFNMEGQPIVRTLSGKKITVYPETWNIEEDGKILAQVAQLPLRLAWAITVHKSQGMTLDAAEIDLSKAFIPGQGYVALSRVRSMEGLVLTGINTMALQVNQEVITVDAWLKRESVKWRKVIERFESDEMEAMHREFIQRSGGTVDEKEIQKNKNKVVEEAPQKIPTHLQTKALYEQGLPLADIAKLRGVTMGTIVTHIEKMKEEGHEIDIKRIKPKASDMKKIKKAFSESKDGKLTPVHKMLKGEYTFEELRIARLFLG
ncbi:MAG: helix-turn-helix domain-containing protein [Candidatus Paceibacterota bacterium]